MLFWINSKINKNIRVTSLLHAHGSSSLSSHLGANRRPPHGLGGGPVRRGRAAGLPRQQQRPLREADNRRRQGGPTSEASERRESRRRAGTRSTCHRGSRAWPQITVTFVNGVEEVFDATATAAQSIRNLILENSRRLRALTNGTPYQSAFPFSPFQF